MSKARKLWTIVGAVLTGGVAITVFSLAASTAEAGIKFN